MTARMLRARSTPVPIEHPDIRKEITGSKRNAQRQATRERLVAAGRAYFLRGEFEASSVDVIARAGGVTRATFYLYFPTKESLLRELIKEEIHRQRGMYTRLAAIPAPTTKALLAWMRHFARVTRRSRRMIPLAQVAVGLHPELNAVFWQARDSFVDILGDAYPALRKRPGAAAARDTFRIKAHFMIMEIDAVCINLATNVWPLDPEKSLKVAAGHAAAFLAAARRS